MYILLSLGFTIFEAEISSGLTTFGGSLPSGFTRGHNFLTSLLGRVGVITFGSLRYFAFWSALSSREILLLLELHIFYSTLT